MSDGDEDLEKSARAAEDLVAFFHMLDEAARREYEMIVLSDKRYGEDVEREVREMNQS